MFNKKHYFLYTDNTINIDLESEYDCNINSVSEELSYSTPWFNYDFNDSLRFEFTDLSSNYYIIISDLDTEQIYYSYSITPEENTVYHYSKRYLINYKFTVFKIKHNIIEYPPIASIKFDLCNKDILIIIGTINRSGLGDTLAQLQCLKLFHCKYPNTNIYVCLSYPKIEELIDFSDYKNFINIIDYNSIKYKKFYATYVFGCFFDDKKFSHNKISYKKMSLCQNAS